MTIESEQDRSREFAKSIVHQWENHDRFRVVEGEDSGEPKEVIVARALLRVDAEYGCEVMDPAGTIWQHCADITKERDKLKEEVCKLRALLLGVLENDEDAELYDNANLGGLRQRIRDAITWEVMK